MPKFAVEVREVRTVLVLVDAASLNEAVLKLDKNYSSGEEINDEYSHTLPASTWSVAEWNEDAETSGTAYYYNEATGKYDKKIG